MENDIKIVAVYAINKKLEIQWKEETIYNSNHKVKYLVLQLTRNVKDLYEEIEALIYIKEDFGKIKDDCNFL